MNNVPDMLDDSSIEEGSLIWKLRYCVLDYSDVKNVDYMFIPMLFLESFNTPSIDLRIGNYRIQMPMDWSIIIGDKHSGELEVIELKKLNDRPFQVFAINPITGFMPEFLDIETINVFPDVKWYFPKLAFGHLLAVPLTLKEKSLCVFFCKDINRLPEVLDITQMV